MKFLLLTALALSQVFSASAQSTAFPTSGEIYLNLKKLNVLGSVLYIAAHPDDENTRLLTYFSKEKLYRTGYLSLTRGDGGQNLIGEEQGIELGLIRTQELLAARRIDGAEQFFTRAYDFGFSKSPKETFTKWDKEKILSDVVWVIRKFQPDVIITRFPTTGEGGHGHHTASAIVAVEAFSAAADAKRFPEQLQWVKPWQASRILWNTFNFGGNNTTSSDQFKIDVGGFNPVLGKSYGEIAAESRSQHKSQGFGSASGRGEAFEFFRTIGGNAPGSDLLEGVVTDWKKVKGGEAVSQAIQSLIASFDFMQPQKSVPQLVQVYQQLQALPEGYWRDQKMGEVKNLIVACSGLWVDAFTNVATVAQGDSLHVTTVLNNRLGQNIFLKSIKGEAAANEINFNTDTALTKNKNFIFVKKIYIAPKTPITQPYWLQQKMNEGYFNVGSQQLIGNPNIQPAATVNALLSVEGSAIYLTGIPVKYKFTDPVKGEVYWPFAVVPPYTLKVEPEISILSSLPYTETYTAYTDNSSINEGAKKFLLNKGQQRKLLVSNSTNDVTTLPHLKSSGKASINTTDSFYVRNYKDAAGNTLYDAIQIKHNHIPSIIYFKEAKHVVKNFDYKIVGKKIGYITGAGDKVPEALIQMGYDVVTLSDKELSVMNLASFDAIISGVRAYNTNEWLNTYYEKLMKYVEEGGNLIVQYNTSNQIGPVKAKIGPYNFNISRNRITDENAPVNFLKPQHPVLHYPNEITQDDFKGWIQERSIYHADNWNNNYEPILRMNDPDEAPNDGSLIIAKHGKGFFTYTGLVFFRELPAGVPGAYRLLANLIALNKIKGS